MTASRVFAGVAAASLLSVALAGQRATPSAVADQPLAGPMAITGSPSSARHCVSGQASNVHSLGWVEAATNYTITFDADVTLVTAVARLNLDDSRSTSGYGTPDIRLTASTSGTMVLLVGTNGRAGCYRYKAQIEPPARSVTSVAAAIPRAMLAKPAKSPIQTMAIAGVASAGRACVAGDGVAKAHALGRVEVGARLGITFDSDFDAQAGITNTDVVGQRGTFWVDDDSGGNLDPQLNITATHAGTLVLFVSGVRGAAGCYHYRVEATSLPAPSPTPAPTPSPAPSPSPSPTPTPAPGGTRSFKAVWVSASWGGGRTGSPLNSRGIDPVTGTSFGPLCLANQLTLENHPTNSGSFLDNAFVVTNRCGRLMTVAICRTAGTGGGESSIPVCATDPRETPFNNVTIRVIASSGNRVVIGQSPLNFDVNVLWCSDTSRFNFGAVRGISQLDCIPN